MRGYEGVWSRHVRTSIGTRRLVELTPYEVEQYFRGLKAAGLGKATVRLVQALLHRSCRLARKWSGNTLPNPITDTELPAWSVSERPVPVRAPEAGEVLALLEAASGADVRVATFIRLLAATGMRRGEACALRWDDLDPTRSTVRVDEGIVSVGGSTSARQPKTSASVRLSGGRPCAWPGTAPTASPRRTAGPPGTSAASSPATRGRFPPAGERPRRRTRRPELAVMDRFSQGRGRRAAVRQPVAAPGGGRSA